MLGGLLDGLAARSVVVGLVARISVTGIGSSGNLVAGGLLNGISLTDKIDSTGRISLAARLATGISVTASLVARISVTG